MTLGPYKQSKGKRIGFLLFFTPVCFFIEREVAVGKEIIHHAG